MNKSKKFIIIQDKSIADKLKLAGFMLVSDANGTYTFINSTPKNFTFDEVDTSKIVYTNMLTI